MPTFSPDVEKALIQAVSEADRRRHRNANTGHLLFALCNDRDAIRAMRRFDVNPILVQESMSKFLGSEQHAPNLRGASPDQQFQKVIQSALMIAQGRHEKYVRGDHFLLAMLNSSEGKAWQILEYSGLSAPGVVDFLERRRKEPTSGQYLHEDIKSSNSEFLRRAEKSKSLAAEIDAATAHAPEFIIRRKKLEYRQRSPVGELKQRKDAVKERSDVLSAICKRKANEQPELLNLARRYSKALAGLNKSKGIYPLFLAGAEIEVC